MESVYFPYLEYTYRVVGVSVPTFPLFGPTRVVLFPRHITVRGAQRRGKDPENLLFLGKWCYFGAVC
jgi:hypothetical protein